MAFDKTIRWLNNIDGRDKLCKIIQFSTLLAKSLCIRLKNKEGIEKFAAAYTLMTQSRMLFRLFKSICEIHNIITLIKRKTNDEFDRLISIINRITYLFYWVFDNISALANLNIINLSWEHYHHKAKSYRFWGAVIQTLLQLRHWLHAHHKEITIRIKLQKCHSEVENQELALEINRLKSVKNWIWVEVLKSLADIVVNIQQGDLLARLTDRKIPEFVVGIAGLISAFAANARIVSAI